MFNSNEGYSLADIAAASGRNDNRNGYGFGDGNGWWIILLFFFAFGGWGNGGFGGFGGGNGAAAQGTLTRGELCQDMNFNDLQSGIRAIQDAATNNNIGVLNGISQITSAIADSQYANQVAFDNTNLAMVQNQNSLANQMQSGFCDTRSQISNLGFSTLQGQNAISNQIATGNSGLATQLASQAAAHDRAIADVRYDMAAQVNNLQTSLATATRDIVDSQNENTRSILQQMYNDKIADLQAENQALKFAASQAAQNNYLVDQLAPKLPVASYTVPNPFTGTVYNTCSCMS